MRKFITTHTHTHMTLDKFDFALLKLLQKDSLIPLRELADAVIYLQLQYNDAFKSCVKMVISLGILLF